MCLYAFSIRSVLEACVIQIYTEILGFICLSIQTLSINIPVAQLNFAETANRSISGGCSIAYVIQKCADKYANAKTSVRGKHNYFLPTFGNDLNSGWLLSKTCG